MTRDRAAGLRACRILLVDDEEPNLDLLEALLSAEGFDCLERTNDPREVAGMVERNPPDLVLLDLHMPHRHGLDVLRDLRASASEGEFRPVLVLTADATAHAKESALALGASDFVTKPFDALEVMLRVENLLETRVLHAQQRAARERAEAAEARAALLAEWSHLLALSLDLTTPLGHLPRLIVPRWAPTCDVLLDDRVDAPIDAIVAPIADEARVIGRLVVGRGGAADESLVAELARRAGLAAEKARLLASAEEATRERERLLAVVAHDLRNPLGVVAMYAEMLGSMQPDDADPYTMGALSTMHESAVGMQRLVEDLLDVATLRQGALRVRRAEQSVGAVIDEAERMLRPLAEARGVSLVVQPANGAAGATAPIDRVRLVQMLSNLVGNGVKFTPPGGEVAVRYAVSDDALALSVADTGPGIAPEDLPHIFSAFWQRDQREGRGVGLGLWIARAIAEAHGGSLQVEARPAAGVGATFHVTLPFVDVPRRLED